MINFDLIILFIIFFCVLKGIITGLYKQIKALLCLLIPFIFIYIFNTIVFSKLDKIAFIIKASNFIHKFINNFLDIDAISLSRILIYVLIFVILRIIISLIYKMFSPSVINLLTKDKNKTSKIIGGFIGLVNSYMIILIVFILINPLLEINQNTPIYKLFFEINKSILIKLIYVN